MGTLRRRDQLQQLLWVVQPFLELILVVVPQRRGGNLRRHARFLQPRIRGHEANFIDADSLRARQRSLQLLREFRWFGLSSGKRSRESRQLFLVDAREKLHAGQARRGQQLCKLSFSRRTFQRHAIQQKLRTRRAQQQTALYFQRNGFVQLLRSNLELFERTDMVMAVQSGKLQQDIQASYESASGRCFWVCFHPSPRRSKDRTPSLVP